MQPRSLHGLITTRIFTVDAVLHGFTQMVSLYTPLCVLVKIGTVEWVYRKTGTWY